MMMKLTQLAVCLPFGEPFDTLRASGWAITETRAPPRLAVDREIEGLAHLGGFATAFLYLKSPWAPPSWGELPVRRKAKKPAARKPAPSVGV